jgi:hypothetical protein
MGGGSAGTRALPPALVDVDERVGARVFARRAWVVAPVLELGRVLPSALPPAAGVSR